MPTKEGVFHMEHAVLVPPDRKLYNKNEVTDYLNNPDNISFIRVAELFGEKGGKCIDGREEHEVIGSPAGDFGQLSETIIGLGKQFDRQFSPVELQKIFDWRLKRFGDFYAHTDEHALEHLAHTLHQDGLVDTTLSVEEVTRYISDPPADKQVSLLNYLTDPDFIGCGHIKQMLLDPEAYKMSRKVLQGMIRSFFNVMWNGSAEQKKLLHYDVLSGKHNEGAVVFASVRGDINEDTLVPAIKPTDGKMSIFVVHPQVSAYLRTRMADQFLVDFSSWFPKIDTKMMHERIQELSENGVRETASRLALGLPLYNFCFTK